MSRTNKLGCSCLGFVNYRTNFQFTSSNHNIVILTKSNGINEVLNNPSLGWYYLAEIDGNNAGQLMITREWSDCNNGYFWWIQSVFVKKEYRKNGVYSILHNHAKEKAEKMGAIGLRLYVDTRNKSAQSVYKKLGMVNSNYVFFEDNWSKC